MTLQEQLNQFMQTHNVKQEAVARGVGVSSAMISQWRQGKYMGNNEEVEAKIAAYLQRELGKLSKPELEAVFVSTPTAQKMLDMLRLTHMSCENGLLYAQAGTGKTTAIRYYAQQYPDVILIEADVTDTPSVVLKNIAKKIGTTTTGSLNDIKEGILEKLTQSARMIIVDEAEQLSTKSLEILRRLHDKAGIGLVLVGMPRLLSNLLGKRGELAQLYSRIGLQLPLPDKVANNELMQIARVTLPSLPENALKEMVLMVNGSPRRLWKAMKLVHGMSQSHNEPINVEMVHEAKRMLVQYGD